MQWTSRSSGGLRAVRILVGTLCGIAAALGWAAGFVAAKHGIGVGFSPADLAFHRFFWTGLLLLPLALREGLRNLGGIGWGRGLVMSVLAGPPQAMIAYTGFILVPLGHGTTIQPACAALFGLVLASAMLGEPATLRRIIGGVTIIAGLAGVRRRVARHHRQPAASAAISCSPPPGCSGRSSARFCAITACRPRARRRGGRAVGRLLCAALCRLRRLRRICCNWAWPRTWSRWWYRASLSGVLPIYLFTRAVILLGAGRAATFPALVPGFSLIIGYLALGIVPSLPQVDRPGDRDGGVQVRGEVALAIPGRVRSTRTRNPEQHTLSPWIPGPAWSLSSAALRADPVAPSRND